MADFENLQLRRLHGLLGDIVYEMSRVQTIHFASSETWSPAVNVYRCSDQFVICADLAGVDKGAIQVRAEARKLLLRGRREPPEPDCTKPKPLQILALEIDYGAFAREIALPAEIEPERVTAEQRNGLLWVHLPLRPQA